MPGLLPLFAKESDDGQGTITTASNYLRPRINQPALNEKRALTAGCRGSISARTKGLARDLWPKMNAGLGDNTVKRYEIRASGDRLSTKFGSAGAIFQGSSRPALLFKRPGYEIYLSQGLKIV